MMPPRPRRNVSSAQAGRWCPITSMTTARCTAAAADAMAWEIPDRHLGARSSCRSAASSVRIDRPGADSKLADLVGSLGVGERLGVEITALIHASHPCPCDEPAPMVLPRLHRIALSTLSGNGDGEAVPWRCRSQRKPCLKGILVTPLHVHRTSLACPGWRRPTSVQCGSQRVIACPGSYPSARSSVQGFTQYAGNVRMPLHDAYVLRNTG